jgi:hypothetical protein
MTPNEWLGICVAVSTLVGSLAVAVRFLVKHYLIELKPNSGSSMKDQISRLESRINEADAKRSDMNRKLDHMYDLLIEYMAKSK